MSREVHVRFREGLRVRFPRATRLLVLCKSGRQASLAYNQLQRLLVPAGMPLKEKKSEAYIPLREEPMEWLGYCMKYDTQGKFRIHPSETFIEEFREKLLHAQSQPHAPLRARQILQGLLNHLGPCYRSQNPKKLIRQIRSIAIEFAFEEIQSAKELGVMWRTSWARWKKLQKKVAHSLSN